MSARVAGIQVFATQVRAPVCPGAAAWMAGALYHLRRKAGRLLNGATALRVTQRHPVSPELVSAAPGQ